MATKTKPVKKTISSRKAPAKKRGQVSAEELTASKSELTRRRLLEATADLLAERGFAGTRLSDIADRAECRAPAVYYYFESREALVEEVMFLGISQIRVAVKERLDAARHEDPMTRLDLAIEEHLRFLLTGASFAKASLRNAAQIPPELRKRQLAEMTRYGNMWRKLVRDAAQAGYLRPGTDERIARMLILGAITWTVEWWLPEGGSVEPLISNSKALVMQGLFDPPR